MIISTVFGNHQVVIADTIFPYNRATHAGQVKHTQIVDLQRLFAKKTLSRLRGRTSLAVRRKLADQATAEG